MMMGRKLSSFFIAGLLAVTLAACGSDSNGNNNNNNNNADLTAAQQAQVTSLLQSLMGFANTAEQQSQSLRVQALQAQTITCAGGGDIEIDTSVANQITITYNNCSQGGFTSDGTLVLEDDGSGESTVTINMTVEDESNGETFSQSGSITVNENDDSIDMDMTGTFGSTTYTVTADVTFSSGILDGTVTITVNGDSVTCTFPTASLDPFDTTVATQADYDEACGF